MIAALPKPQPEAPRPRRARRARRPEQRLRPLPSPPTQVTTLPRPLRRLQAGLSVTIAAVGTVTLGLYFWNVSSERHWSQSYRQLEQLRRQELQLTSSNAILRDQLLRQTEKAPQGLVAAKPDSLIFLPPAQARSQRLLPAQAQTALPTPTMVGY